MNAVQIIYFVGLALTVMYNGYEWDKFQKWVDSWDDDCRVVLVIALHVVWPLTWLVFIPLKIGKRLGGHE